MTSRQKYLFLINPIAGDRDKHGLIDLIEDLPWAVRPHILWLEQEMHAAELHNLICADKYNAVVAAGGDGTVHLVARALIGTGVPLGILPMGSGNGLAKDLGLPLEEADAIQTVFYGTPKPLDGIWVNRKPCFHISDLGLNARVIKEYSTGSFRTLKAYAWHLLRFYFSAGPNQLVLTLDGKQAYAGDAYLVAVCNGMRYGSDLFINPQGKPDDGRAEVVVLKNFPKSAGPDILLDLMTGNLDLDYFECFSGKEILLELEKPWPWQVDGEYSGEATVCEAQIQPGLIQVLC